MNKELITLVNRLEGQVGGLKRKLAASDYDSCSEVLQQIKAIQGALSNVAQKFVQQELQNCMGSEDARPKLEAEISQLIKLIK